MRKVIRDKNYFVFRDSDGILGFTIKMYEDSPLNPRFLLDENGLFFLLRRPKQIILLDAAADGFLPVLMKSKRVRFLETPEDSSQIVRQYEVPVIKIESVSLTHDQIVPEDAGTLSHSA